MENLPSDILEDDFIKIFEPIHWVLYSAGFHRVKIEDKFVTPASVFYQCYSCVIWVLNIISIVYFEINCETNLDSMSNVYAYKISEFIVVAISAMTAFWNNFYNGTLNSQLYVKLQKIDRVVKMPRNVNLNRKMFLLSASSTAVVLVVWVMTIVVFNLIAIRGVCPSVLFTKFFAVASYMEILLAGFILMFLARRLDHVNVALEKEATKLRDANMSLAAKEQYGGVKEQDHDKLAVAVHLILDSWSDCIQLFQFPVLLLTCELLIYNLVLMLSIVTAIRDENVDPNYLIINAVIFVLGMTSILLLSFLATSITSKMRQMRSICFTVLAEPSETVDKLQKSAEHILMLLGTTSIFTIYDMYTVDNRLPLRMFAIIATYTIVILQFATL